MPCFTEADKAALDATLRDVEGLPDDWLRNSNANIPTNDGKPIYEVNKDGNVTKINLGATDVSGSINLTKLPPHLRELWISRNRLSGPLDLRCLPSSLVTLSVYDNHFNSVIRGVKFPTTLKTVWLEHNKFKGVIIRPPDTDFNAQGNKDLIVCKTQDQYDRVIDEMTGCVRMLRAANSSTHNAHDAFKIYSVAQQTINFLVMCDVYLE